MFDVSKQWFYANGETKEGPVSGEIIISLIKNGQINKATKLWSDGLPFWIVAGEVEGLFIIEPPPLTLKKENEKSTPLSSFIYKNKYAVIAAILVYFIINLTVSINYFWFTGEYVIYFLIHLLAISSLYMFYKNKCISYIIITPNIYIIAIAFSIGVVCAFFWSAQNEVMLRILAIQSLVFYAVISILWIYISIDTIPKLTRDISPLKGLILFFVPIINIIGCFIVIKALKKSYNKIPTIPYYSYQSAFIGCWLIVISSIMRIFMRILSHSDMIIAVEIIKSDIVRFIVFYFIPVVTGVVWIFAYNGIYKQVRWLQTRLSS